MPKQIPITANELQKLSIWKTKHQLASARGRGLITLIKKDGKQFYDLSKIDSRFLTTKNQSA